MHCFLYEFSDRMGLPLFPGQNFSDDDIRYMLRQFTDKETVDFVSFALSLHSKIGDPRCVARCVGFVLGVFPLLSHTPHSLLLPLDLLILF